MSYWNWNFLFIRTGWTVLQNVYVCFGKFDRNYYFYYFLFV